MKSLLIVAPCSPKGVPAQAALIADQLRQTGVQVTLLSKACSSWGRLLDIVFRGLVLIPSHEVVLINAFGGRAFVYETFVVFWARLWKKPLILMIRNGNTPEFVKKWPTWTRLVFRQPNLVLVPHDFLNEELSKLGFRIDGVIPNFIELDKYKFRKRSILAPRFLYLRGSHPNYNPEMALRAFALIQRKYPDALLTMAGREAQGSTFCRALVRDLNLRNVYFIGLVPKEQIPVLADKHDIHLHTNRVENMPVTVIEMWACGLPIVGTNVGGMPYLVRNGSDAILVKSEDYEAMANICVELLSNNKLAETLSCNGRARAEELTWQRVMPWWERALLTRSKESFERGCIQDSIPNDSPRDAQLNEQNELNFKRNS